MTLMTVHQSHEMTLADYEARITLYKEQIGTGYIGIGRTLLEAKEAHVVEHGQWEAWVTGVTGLSIQQAQRCMRAAREIREGSALAQLEMSKALMLLSSGLDGDTQEDLAKKAMESEATIRTLREEIRAEKAAAAAQKAQSQAHEQQMRQANDAAIQRLQGELDEMKNRPAAGISPEAQAEIDRLHAELAENETRLERQAELRQKAQQELLNYKAQAAHGRPDGDAVDLSDRVEMSVRAFLATEGALPHMDLMIAALPTSSREKIRAYVEMVSGWAEGMRKTLDALYIDGTMA